MSNLPPATVPPPQTCRYCGSALVPGYYFCRVCATPHSNVELMLPRQPPPYLSEGKLVAARAPHVAALFWTYFGVVVGLSLICYLLFEKKTEYSLLLISAVLGIVTCVFATMYWPSLSVQFKRFGFNQPAAWIGLAGLVPLLGVNYLYHEIVMKALGVRVPIETEPLSFPAILMFFCVLPAVTEEIAFRGLVQHWLQVALRPARAIIIAAALFTALHFSILSAPYLLAVGMLLGWTKWKTGSLYPSMLIHLLHNLVVVALF